jgi:hypothetical protein
MAPSAFSGATVLGAVGILEAKVSEGLEIGPSAEHHVSAASAVATVRASLGNILFPAEGNRPRPSRARMDGDCNFIYKLLHPLFAGRSYRDELFSFPDLERDAAVDLRKQRIILAAAYVESGMELGAPLAHDDLTRGDKLPPVTLYSEALGNRLSAVLGASSTFLMCHTVLLSL